MFENKWTLLVRVTLNTSRIGSSCQSRLFEFEAAMRIMAIAALHSSFEDLVMEGKIELMFCFGMTAHTKLRFAIFQQLERREARFLSIRQPNKNVRTS